MAHPLGEWMTDNADLFRYAGELACMREGADRLLLSGAPSAFLSPLFRTIYPKSTIIAVTEDAEALEEALQGTDGVEGRMIPFQECMEKQIDIVVSVLAVETLETRDLTRYLFSLHDCMNEGGNLLLSFPSTDRFMLSPMKEEVSWFSMERKVRMKRYQAEDVMKALQMIGFSIRAVEKDDNPDLGPVITIHAVRC